jgi:putative DNA primase/helicase
LIRFFVFIPIARGETRTRGKIEHIPALLAAYRSIDDDSITAVHRVRLDQRQRWPKAERRMLGLVRRAAVKLDVVEGDTLVIAEGVETGLAARQLGLRPAWALGSVGAISFFPVLDGIKRLIILGESGKPSTDAIKLCGQRWSRKNRRVQIIYSEVGSDLNDALMATRND